MSKKWVYLFNELKQAEAYVGGLGWCPLLCWVAKAQTWPK